MQFFFTALLGWVLSTFSLFTHRPCCSCSTPGCILLWMSLMHHHFSFSWLCHRLTPQCCPISRTMAPCLCCTCSAVFIFMLTLPSLHFLLYHTIFASKQIAHQWKTVPTWYLLFITHAAYEADINEWENPRWFKLMALNEHDVNWNTSVPSLWSGGNA